jgi:DNA-binding MarR family transcriptional regulator
MSIEKDINQQKPFKNNYLKAYVNIMYTASWINKRQSDVIKKFDLSIQQYNILRILKGMNGEPVTVKLLTERMIDKMSNASRLVDKLLAKNYLRRIECSFDRRKVDIYITDEGSKILEQASQALDTLLDDSNLEISLEEAGQLSELLDKLRM